MLTTAIGTNGCVFLISSSSVRRGTSTGRSLETLIGSYREKLYIVVLNRFFFLLIKDSWGLFKNRIEIKNISV